MTLSGRFTVAASSDEADDRVLSLSLFIRKKNGWKHLGVDRTEPSILAVIMHKPDDISYRAGSRTTERRMETFPPLFKRDEMSSPLHNTSAR